MYISLSLSLYIYIYIYRSLSLYIYIYIYRERERFSPGSPRWFEWGLLRGEAETHTHRCIPTANPTAHYASKGCMRMQTYMHAQVY